MKSEGKQALVCLLLGVQRVQRLNLVGKGIAFIWTAVCQVALQQVEIKLAQGGGFVHGCGQITRGVAQHSKPVRDRVQFFGQAGGLEGERGQQIARRARRVRTARCDVTGDDVLGHRVGCSLPTRKLVDHRGG